MSAQWTPNNMVKCPATSSAGQGPILPRISSNKSYTKDVHPLAAEVIVTRALSIIAINQISLYWNVISYIYRTQVILLIKMTACLIIYKSHWPVDTYLTELLPIWCLRLAFKLRKCKNHRLPTKVVGIRYIPSHRRRIKPYKMSTNNPSQKSVVLVYFAKPIFGLDSRTTDPS